MRFMHRTANNITTDPLFRKMENQQIDDIYEYYEY